MTVIKLAIAIVELLGFAFLVMAIDDDREKRVEMAVSGLILLVIAYIGFLSIL